MIISIPYQYKNNVGVGDCGTEFLVINEDLCGKKYFALRVVSVTEIDGNIATSFSWNGDIYTTTELSTEALIILLASAFACPNSYGCANQESSFDWTLTPIVGTRYISSTIVDDVQVVQPNRIYKITNVTVNSVVYVGAPVTIWDDATSGKAAILTYNYIAAIVTYINTLSIPELQGSINMGVNGTTDNYGGAGLLEMYFDSGTTVTLTFSSNIPSTGAMVEDIDVTTMLQLDLNNTSSITTGDVLEVTNYIVSDGSTTLGNSTTPDATVIPFNIFCGGECGLDTSQGWILTQVIVVESGCARNNLSTGIITNEEILAAIGGDGSDEDAGVTQTGSSIG